MHSCNSNHSSSLCCLLSAYICIISFHILYCSYTFQIISTMINHHTFINILNCCLQIICRNNLHLFHNTPLISIRIRNKHFINTSFLSLTYTWQYPTHPINTSIQTKFPKHNHIIKINPIYITVSAKNSKSNRQIKTSSTLSYICR